MPRQIFSVPQSDNSDSNEKKQHDDEVEFSEKSLLNREEVVISADQMRMLVNEWDKDSDLIIDYNLASKIKKFIDYQETLDPLRQKLAKRIYEPYILIADEDSYKKYVEYINSANLYVNGEFISEIAIIIVNSARKGVLLEDFRTILISFRNKMAKWFKDERYIVIDLFAYIASIDGKIIISPANENEDVTYNVQIEIKLEN